MCEICGRPIEGKGKEIFVERAKLTVCKNCVRYGTPIREEVRKPAQKAVSAPSREADLEIRDDYPEAIRVAREKLGLTQKDLAQKINEKESVIHRVETGQMRPPPALVHKLESVLSVKLMERVEEPEAPHRRGLTDDLTIGDIIKIRKK